MSNDKNEDVELTTQDQMDLAALGVTTGDEPEFHPILESWRELLKPAKDEADAKITPQYANRIVQTYSDITFSEMNHFRDLYYARILELEQVLLDVIASDDQCLLVTSPEEDKEKNSRHYKTLLLEWQKHFLLWELSWDTMDEDAGVQIGVFGELHKMFFGDVSVTAHLQNIQFEFTDQDRAEVAVALQEVKDGASE
jgi:hypothetical protein